MNKENFSFQQSDQYAKVMQDKLGAVLHTLKENSAIAMPLKIAFQAVRQMLEHQSDTLEYLQEQILKKANKTEMHQLLVQKVSVVDLSSSIGDLRDVLDKKISAAEFNTTLEESEAITTLERKFEAVSAKVTNENEIMSCVMKEIGETVDRLQKELLKKTDEITKESKEVKSVISKINEKVERQIEKQRHELQRITSKLHEDMKHHEHELTETRSTLMRQIQESAARMDTLATSASTNNFIHGKEEMLHNIQSLRQICDENEKELKRLTGKITKKKQYEAIQDTVVRAVEKLRDEFKEYVKERLPVVQSGEIHDSKECKYTTKEQFMKEMMQLQLVLNSKTSLQEVKLAFKAFEQDMLYNLEALKNDLNRRIDNDLINQAKQPVELYERSPLLSKSSLSIQQVYLSVEEFRRYEHDQNIIYESLCRENIVGRWSFKSDGPTGSRVASWDNELINTLPDNFVWVSHSHYIKIKNSGFYRLVMGIFTDCISPQLELMVNEKRLTVIKTQEGLNNFEEVAKVSEVYVYLKDNSRLSVSFTSSRQAEGFLYAKRL